MIETTCGPQSLKDLLFGPLQGKFATSGMEKRAGHSGCSGGGLGRWPGPCSCAPSWTPAPTPGRSGGPHLRLSPAQACLSGGPHFPCPLHGPSEPVLPANTCSVDELLSQRSPLAPASRFCSRASPSTAPTPMLRPWSCVALSQMFFPLGLGFLMCLVSGSDSPSLGPFPAPSAHNLQSPQAQEPPRASRTGRAPWDLIGWL